MPLLKPGSHHRPTSRGEQIRSQYFAALPPFPLDWVAPQAAAGKERTSAKVITSLTRFQWVRVAPHTPLTNTHGKGRTTWQGSHRMPMLRPNTPLPNNAWLPNPHYSPATGPADSEGPLGGPTTPDLAGGAREQLSLLSRTSSTTALMHASISGEGPPAPGVAPSLSSIT